jgi:hypothetical protein
MSLTPHRRLAQIEQTLEALALADLQHACARAGAVHGHTGAYLLQEFRRCLADPNDRWMAAFEATLTPAEQREMQALKAELRRILRLETPGTPRAGRSDVTY